MEFGAALACEAQFERLDTGASVQLSMNLGRVPGDPRAGALLNMILSGEAAPEDRRAFAELWQERVRRILIDHAGDPELISVSGGIH
jgi:hypothetical protein